MGRSNITENLERRLGGLLGERIAKLEEVERAEEAAASLPLLRDRLWEIDELVSATERLLTADNPDWTRDHIDPVKPFVHQIPIKLGAATRKALDVLRDADEPMTVREVLVEILRREGLEAANTATRDRIYKTIEAGFRKRRESGVLSSDAGWPARWTTNASRKTRKPR